MAHELDTMVYTGDEPWHQLGNRIDPSAPFNEWIKQSGLVWSVEEHPVKYLKDDTVMHVDGHKVLVRSDNNYPLSVVSNRYNVVQPQDVVAFYKRLVESYGFQMETMGSLKEGKRIWGLAKTNESFSIMGQDVLNMYVLLATSFDKTIATRVIPTTVRVVCNNTLSAAYMAEEEDRVGLVIPHSAIFDLNRVFDNILDTKTIADNFESNITTLADIKISDAEAVEYFINLMYSNKTPKEVMATTRSRKLIGNVVNIFKNAPGQNLRSANGTVWGAVNAITYYFDHEYGRTQDNRMDSAWFGKGNHIKDNAMKKALAMAA